MEDADKVVADLGDGTAFFAVFDGHGGKEVSRYLSKHLHHFLKSSPSFSTSNLPDALKEAFLNIDYNLLTPKAQQQLKLLKSKSPQLDTDSESDSESSDESQLLRLQRPYQAMTVGSTAVVALIKDGFLVVANVGDSRCVLCRGGRAIPLTEDHKPWMEGERKRIVKAGGKIDGKRVSGSGPLNLDVSRTVGDHSLKRNDQLGPESQIISSVPDITKEILTREDEFIVLACDGIWNQITNQQCVDFIRGRLQEEASRTLSGICEELMDCCLSPEAPQHSIAGCDNMTVIIVQLTPK
jgi:protein phosphatase 1G